MSKFGSWLQKELAERRISQTELAHAIRVTPAQVSRIISGERSASNDTLNKIAQVLKLPPELVYQEAGHLPPKTEDEKLIEQIIALTEGLSEESKKDIYEYARMRSRIDEEKARYDAAKNRKPRQAGT